VHDLLCKEKKACASTRVELELCKARVTELLSTARDSGGEAYVGPQTSYFEHDGADIHSEMKRSIDEMLHKGRENMNTACGFPTDRGGDSGEEKDFKDKFGVTTEAGITRQATEDEVPHVDTKVSTSDQVVSSFQLEYTILEEEVDVVRTSGV